WSRASSWAVFLPCTHDWKKPVICGVCGHLRLQREAQVNAPEPLFIPDKGAWLQLLATASPTRATRPGTVSPELASVPGTGVVLWRQPVHHLEVGDVGVVLRVVGDQRQPMCQSDGSILQIEIRRGEAMIQLPGAYVPELAGRRLVERKNDHLLEQVEKSR